MKRKLSAVTFIAIIAAMAAAFAVTPKRAYSDNENRYLAQMPELTGENILSGGFSRGFEAYVSDGFPGRDGWISLKSRMDLALGRRDTGGVYITGDGWLMEMFRDVDRGRFEANLGYVRKARELYSGLDSFGFMLVPTASRVLEGKLGMSADVDQEAMLREAADLLSCDCLAALEPHCDEYIYYRTDHHWTGLGAYYCYAALMGEGALPLESFTARELSRDFLGTTFSRAGIYFEKDAITAYEYGAPTLEHNMSGEVTEGLYDESYLTKKDKYSVFLGGNQALTLIRTGNEGGRLLLVKDSYANTLVQFLLPHYSEIHVVDLRSFASSLHAYAEEAGITDMLVLYNLKGFSAETSVFRLCQ